MKKSATASKARVLESNIAFRGKVFHVAQDKVQEPNGVTAVREVIRHSGSAVILAVDESGREPRILLERQFRYAANDFLWEIPAGRIDPGETPLAAAKRELLEETGFSAVRWKRGLRFFVSPGFLDEEMNLFLATGLKHGIATPEEDERIEARFFPLSTALRMCMSNRIRDAKTMISIFWFSDRRGRKGPSRRSRSQRA
jgi:ADP-ribose pyrophosphatase